MAGESRRLRSEIGVNFDDGLEGTGLRISYRGAVIMFGTRRVIPDVECERLCEWIDAHGLEFFHDDGTTITSASPADVIKALLDAGFEL